MKLVSLLASILVSTAADSAMAQNAMPDWAAIVAPAVDNASAHRPPASAETHTIIPKPIKREHPKYPQGALRKGIDGSVLLEFSVDGHGHVVAPRVVDATPAGVFERAALEAVSAWRYESLGTETKNMRVRLTFRERGGRPWEPAPPSSTATAGTDRPLGVAPDSVAAQLPQPAPPPASR